MTIFRPQEDKNYRTKTEMFEQIVMALGGRMAESLMLDDISIGASGDIQQASSIARAMITQYGMSERLGPISFDSSDHSIFIGRDFGTTKSYSEETAAIIDEEVKRIFDEATAKCTELLTEHREQLINVAEYLLANETMDGEDFSYFCDHGCLPERTVRDNTIEPPARKISYVSEPVQEGALPERDAEAAAPQNGEPDASSEAETPDEPENPEE